MHCLACRATDAVKIKRTEYLLLAILIQMRKRQEKRNEKAVSAKTRPCVLETNSLRGKKQALSRRAATRATLWEHAVFELQQCLSCSNI
eukprot:1144867-Pelagomonas_calceolata.AAC.2